MEHIDEIEEFAFLRRPPAPNRPCFSISLEKK